MLKLNRRALIALAAAMAASPVMAEEATPDAGAATEIKDYSLGSPDAPVKIVEYASYTCPHCATFHATVFKDLKRDYIDTGKVHFTMREVYFDRYALWAAMVARCGGDMRYFGIHDMLFDQQAEWRALEGPMAVVERLKTIGVSAGLEDAAVQACLNDAPMAEALIARSEANMAADAIEGTPTVLVNGEKQTIRTYDELKAIIDAKLAG